MIKNETVKTISRNVVVIPLLCSLLLPLSGCSIRNLTKPKAPTPEDALEELEDDYSATRIDYNPTSRDNNYHPEYDYDEDDCDCDLSDDECIYYFYRTEEYEYATLDITDAVYYSYDEKSREWEFDKIKYMEDFEITWHLEGEYMLEDAWGETILITEITQTRNDRIHIHTYPVNGFAGSTIDEDYTLDGLINYLYVGDSSMYRYEVAPDAIIDYPNALQPLD